MNSFPQEIRGAVAIDYIKKERKIIALTNSIEKIELPGIHKNILSKILTAGGARTALKFILTYKLISLQINH